MNTILFTNKSSEKEVDWAKYIKLIIFHLVQYIYFRKKEGNVRIINTDAK